MIRTIHDQACIVGVGHTENSSDSGRSEMKLACEAIRAAMDDAGLGPDDLRLVHYFNIYPAFLLSLHPDYVLTHTIWPGAADRSVIRCEWLFAPEAIDRSDFDPSDAVDFWHVTNEQDWPICERAQKGVQSRSYRPGRYQSLEKTIYFFDNWYLRFMETGLSDNCNGDNG